mmetsp:Transcript_8028/g.33789  ORF Transcript_8028/g.33789 Transcript_8028/m.33789 type:complete len:978 (-) Transcript_8028:44-2977(-)|eukprot:CAMPEP_0114621370 /NCGR_PEP_ID=MMETSP0168-20121206/9195_1 /TAXON_ID=95228 ORGANISM="Vannella sp., Strain DIVA3 517/6/12" /NCGR_SAMPLE_ID=MMETSP0168 /ASSEMBLY_ACC=CAM_ASM_000044 /LENGTH=977 /DNA_ID=CAMNT_0001832569 /DNA_START=93 /DNA_END=3026 /DNA_ORIENTATION=-
MRVSTSLMAVCGLLLISAMVLSVQAEHFASTISSLPRFQSASGGFRDSPRAEESLEATADALFLSSLYGLRNTINAAGVPEFVRGFRNSDGGYGAGKSDVASTRAAVLAYAHLEFTIPDPTETANFVRSLIDPQNSLFGARPGARGDLQSTAYALEILDLLGEGKRGLSQVVGGLNTYLSAHVTTDGSTQYFNFPSEPLSLTSANFYAVYIASRIEFEFDSPDQWASFVSQMQAPSGGFFADFSRSSITFQSSAHAVGTLRLLHDAAGASVAGTVNTAALRAFCASAPFDLRSAYSAHYAVALTDHFRENFKFFVSYSTADGTPVTDSLVIQGTRLKPELTVRAFSGSAHVGLTAGTTVQFEDGTSDVSELRFDHQSQQYIASKFISADSLGAVSFQFNMRQFVVGIGEISFSVSSEKSVGYAVEVTANAVHDITGQVVKEGKDVSVGTTFNFDVAMSSVLESSITAGDFNLVFSVLDSSNVAIHREVIAGQGNTKDLTFAYTFSESNIPSGDLGFAFQVQGPNGNVHSTAVKKYRLSIPMVATDITFSGASDGLKYQLGDTVSVTIQPGSYPDLRSVTSFTTTDFAGTDIGNTRSFFLDCVTEKGSVVRSIPASAGQNGRYTFSFDLDTTLDSVGSTDIVFRYQAATGESITLQNYDSDEQQLYDDSEPLAVTVDTELHITDVIEQPSGGDFFYGNIISFQFEVKDLVSGEYVSAGERGNVYMALTHTSAELGGRTFTSVKVPAEEGDASSFTINWEINPNAVKGESTLVLIAEDADENQVDLFKESSKEAVSYTVNIGGELDIESSTFSSSDFFSSHTAHIVDFTLSCQGKSLRNAKLRTSVVYGGEEVYSAPVAYDDEGYSVSWTTDHRSSPSGTYTVRVFRETDQSKAEESEEWKQKQLRQKLREVELSGETFDQEAFLASLEVESDSEPLFEVSYYHKEVSRGAPPVKVEWMVMLGLITAFVYASKKKVNYE